MIWHLNAYRGDLDIESKFDDRSQSIAALVECKSLA